MKRAQNSGELGEEVATGDSGRREGSDTVPERFHPMQYAGAPIVTSCSCEHSYFTQALQQKLINPLWGVGVEVGKT